MRTIQKYELGFGLATPLTTFLLFYFAVVRPSIESYQSDERYWYASGDPGLLVIVSFLWLLTLLVAYGAYRHIKGKRDGAFFLYIDGLVFVILWGFLGFFFMIWSQSFLWSAAIYTPVLLAVLTMIFAFSSKQTLRQSDETFK